MNSFVAVSWGDVPTWISAVVSLLALTAAAVAAVQAARVYQLERSRDLRTEAELKKRALIDKQSQAAQVCAWTAEVRDRVDAAPAVLLAIRNASDLPIYDLVVSVLENGAPLESVEFPVLPPTDEPARRPLASASVERRGTDLLAVRLDFRDSSGTNWVRNESGVLSERSPAKRASTT